MQNRLKNKNLFDEKCLLDGEWISSQSTIDVTNPATEEKIGTIPNMGAQETKEVIGKSLKAFKKWKNTLAKERSAILYKWYELIIQNADDLALILTSEQGKPLSEAKGEVIYAANFIQWFSEEAKRLNGDLIPSHMPNSQIMVTKEPIGVVGAITPWNFPLAMITRKAAPALAAGCSIIIKPAELTPYSAIALCKLAQEAGVPNGVINIITGKSIEIGAELTTNKIIKKITFTGSTPVGKILMKQSADSVKKLSLELGGNAPFIVFDDANIDIAVNATIATKFRNSGQTCVCANRIYVQSKIYDEFAIKLKQKVSEFKIGEGTQEGITHGPLIDEKAIEKIQEHIKDALNKGAKVVIGGNKSSKGKTFFEPTILKDVPKDALVNKEETFGPLAPLIKFDTEQEAIDMANDTEFGLAAYFCSNNLGRIFRVNKELEAGIVGINEGIISTEMAPFGGVKESGLGREGSKYGMDDYLELKYTFLKH